MAGKIDLVRLKAQVEAAMETLLRAADARVSWKQASHQQQPIPSEATNTNSGSSSPYTFIPGVYCSFPSGITTTSHENDSDSAHPTPPPVAATHGNTELNDGELRVVLHGDNSFEYTWTMKRSGARAMEFCVEMTGKWTKPVLNRSRRGDEDQRVFLHATKMRFQRLSNYGKFSIQDALYACMKFLYILTLYYPDLCTVTVDVATDTWKLCLKTLTRHGSDWTVVGETERGVPPIVIVLSCTGAGASLESTGAAQAAKVLSNSPACRVLAGLTKKIANKLGAPIDVMTDRWLPAPHVVLVRAPENEESVRKFNPFFWCGWLVTDILCGCCTLSS